MSTSLLYHAFGIRGYRHVRTEFLEGAVILSIEQERETLRCPACWSSRVTAHGGEERLFRLVPIGGKPCHLFFRVPRVECHDCFVTRQVHVPFAEARRRYTHVFERALGTGHQAAIVSQPGCSGTGRPLAQRHRDPRKPTAGPSSCERRSSCRVIP